MGNHKLDKKEKKKGDWAAGPVSLSSTRQQKNKEQDSWEEVKNESAPPSL